MIDVMKAQWVTKDINELDISEMDRKDFFIIYDLYLNQEMKRDEIGRQIERWVRTVFKMPFGPATIPVDFLFSGAGREIMKMIIGAEQEEQLRFSSGEAGALLGKSRTHMHHIFNFKGGKIPFERDGEKYLVTKKALIDFVESDYGKKVLHPEISAEEMMKRIEKLIDLKRNGITSVKEQFEILNPNIDLKK